MVLYILNSSYERMSIVEDFESLIWTERLTAYGDIEMAIQSTAVTRRQFVGGVLLGLDGSNRIMKVETVENGQDEENRQMLKVTGRTLEAMLEDRVAAHAITGTEAEPEWVLEGSPANIARHIYHQIVGLGVLDLADKIPGAIESSLYPPSTLPEATDTVTLKIKHTSVYKAIKDICDVYDLGFRLVRGTSPGQLRWDVYSGYDRTSSQTTVPAVVFSPDLDNLNAVNELASIAQYKNVAYVFGKNGALQTQPLTAPSEPSGFERHVMFVDASDIDLPAGSELNLALIQRGQEALAKQRRIAAFDGEISQDGKYKYEVDYFLGDMIEMRNDDGVQKRMRVTEQIFVFDAEGIRSYPTLSDSLFITPGTWLAWAYDEEWVDAVGYWEDA